MRLPEFEHLQPESLEEAVSLLTERGQEAKVIAGGTDLLVSMKRGLLAPRYLINLKGIAGLDFVSYNEETGLRIGALTRLATLIRSPLIRDRFPIIAQAARSVAAPPLQTMGTLGGNLCQDSRCFYYNQSEFWRAAQPDCFKNGGMLCRAIGGSDRCHSAYQGDLAPVLIALKARVKLARNGEQRAISLERLYTGKGENPIGLALDEVLTEIEIPPQAGKWRGEYQKLRYRGAMDYPLVGVAAVLGQDGDGPRCTRARIVLTAVAPAPVLVEEAGQILQTQHVDEGTMARAAQAVYGVVHPIARIGSTSLYRHKMARVLSQRAIARAWEGG
jgi:4-hydroxybenzoyl-CoA reductase beta subunit